MDDIRRAIATLLVLVHLLCIKEGFVDQSHVRQRGVFLNGLHHGVIMRLYGFHLFAHSFRSLLQHFLNFEEDAALVQVRLLTFAGQADMYMRSGGFQLQKALLGEHI